MSVAPVFRPVPSAPARRGATRYQSLDALRGIAAMAVVFQHCMMSLPVWSDVILHGEHKGIVATVIGYPPLNLFWAGNVAVKVFFALSGFVLALMFVKTTPSYSAFVVKRICRIYLPYIAVVAVAMVLMASLANHPFYHPSEWLSHSWNHPITAGLLTDHVLMLGQEKYNFVDNPIWSLVHEMRYSLIFPAIMWVVLRSKWSVTLIVSFTISVGAMAMLRQSNDYWLIDSLQYAFLFVSGAVLAVKRVEVTAGYRELRPSWRVAIGVASLLLLSFYGLGQGASPLVRQLSSIAPHLGAPLLLVSVLGSVPAQRILESGPFLWIGKISYSLYLSHLVLLLTLLSCFGGRVPVYFILIATPLLALLTADLLYRFVERSSIALGHGLASRMEPGKKVNYVPLNA